MAPQAVLGRLSRLLRQLEPGRTATLLYLVLDPHGGSLVASSAGHPPPLLARGDGEPDFMEMPGSAPLGATRHATYEDCEHSLEPGCALVLYTDGLVERPGESLDAGLERLRALVRQGDENLDHLGDSLVHELLPEGPTEDDAALLLARALPLSDSLTTQFPAEVESIPLMRRMLGRWLDEAGATTAESEDISLAASEACANAIEHAYGPAPGVLEVSAQMSAGEAVVAVRDFGNWRAPRGENRGRGLMLMHGLADSVEVMQRDEGTTVQLRRRLGAVAA
jgi:anti-sigma regulatory factor (Ser/Thr protein kinase)